MRADGHATDWFHQFYSDVPNRRKCDPDPAPLVKVSLRANASARVDFQSKTKIGCVRPLALWSIPAIIKVTIPSDDGKCAAVARTPGSMAISCSRAPHRAATFSSTVGLFGAASAGREIPLVKAWSAKLLGVRSSRQRKMRSATLASHSAERAKRKAIRRHALRLPICGANHDDVVHVLYAPVAQDRVLASIMWQRYR